MPQLQRIQQDQTINNAGQMSIGGAMAPGDAAARVGTEVENIGSELVEKQINLQQVNDFNQHSNDAKLRIDQAIRDQMQDPDFRTQPQRVDKAIQDISSDILSNVQSPEVRSALQTEIGNMHESSIIQARDYAHTQEISYGRSVFEQGLETSRNRMAQFDDSPLGQISKDQEQTMLTRSATAAVVGGLYTPDQMQKMLSEHAAGVAGDKAEIEGLIDPTGTIQDLLGSGKNSAAYDDLNPQQRFAKAGQIIVKQRELAEQNLKAYNLAETGAIGQAQLSIEKGDGSFGFEQLQDLKKQFPNMSRENIESLFNGILKGPQRPNDRPTEFSLTSAVAMAHPTVTSKDITSAYNAGKINYDTALDLNVKLLKNNASQDTQEKSELRLRQSAAEQIWTQISGGDPEIHANGMKYLTTSGLFVPGGPDPLTLIPDMEKAYGPALARLGGMSEKGAISKFQSAYKAYNDAVSANQKLHGGIMGTLKYDTGVFTDYQASTEVKTRQASLLEAARASGRDVGAAPPGAVPGKWFTDKHSGKQVQNIAGRLILPE